MWDYRSEPYSSHSVYPSKEIPHNLILSHQCSMLTNAWATRTLNSCTMLPSLELDLAWCGDRFQLIMVWFNQHICLLVDPLQFATRNLITQLLYFGFS